MKNKIRIIFISIVLLLMVCYRYYVIRFSNDGIFDHVVRRDGYTLSLQQEQIPIEVFIKPEWIPFDPEEHKELNIKLLELHNTNIMLDNVLNRNNDIYFSFDTTFNMNYENGTFLYNAVINEDGTFTSPSPGEITLFDQAGNEIPKGQTGYGPGAAFSVGIRHQDQELINEGFYVKYTGYILYDYSKE